LHSRPRTAALPHHSSCGAIRGGAGSSAAPSQPSLIARHPMAQRLIIPSARQ
jgi:hypothetical protein